MITVINYVNDISKTKFVFLNESLFPYMIAYIKRNLKYGFFKNRNQKAKKINCNSNKFGI